MPRRSGTSRPIWNLAELFRSKPEAASHPETDLAPRAIGHRARHDRRDHLHLRRDRRAQGRRPHPQEHPREHRPDRARDGEVQEVHAPVPPDPVPEPAAPQPHVRAGDGDVRAADAARPRGVHPQLLARRHRPADPRAADLGAGLRAEDPRGAARLHHPRRAGSGGAAAGRDALGEALVALPPHPPDVRVQVLGDGRRRGAARSRARGVLGPARASSSSRDTA